MLHDLGIAFNSPFVNLYVDAKDYLKKEVVVKTDRQLGTKHPKHGFIYPVNYGYIPNTISGDGEELDVYVGNIKKFTALPGATGDNYAVRVTEVIREEQ